MARLARGFNSLSRIAEIQYQPDAARTFRALSGLPRPVLLDSGQPLGLGGRFDIIAADPRTTFITRGASTTIRGRGGPAETSAADPLALIRAALGPLDASIAAERGLPFCGGAIGYFAYDLGRRYESVRGTAVDDIGMPEMVVGIYDWAVVVDHAEQRSWLVGGDRDPLTAARWDAIRRLAEDSPSAQRDRFDVLSAVSSNLSRDEYAAAFAAVKEHIRLGNCYQVNLTQRFRATVSGDSWQAYLGLREANPAPFAAYLDFPEGQVLSSSPERFLRVVDGNVETRPIKGTRPRSADSSADRRLAEALRASPKDRAENVMIVDLLRNDLGRCCLPGTVRAERMFEVESFASVHHLVSTVTGRLDPRLHSLDLLRACFPGGSITGAPKLAAMRIIDELEPHRRGVYCGSIGYIGYDGNMDTNIAIRTLVRHGDTICAWAGGGIVADSALEAEYQESFDKAATLLSILSPVRPAVAG